MWQRSAIVAMFAFLVTALAHAQASHLPPAPIQPKVQTACAECHDTGIIVQQRLSASTWSKELDKMIRWGAVVAPEDRDGFVQYLASNFGPDKAPAAPHYGKPSSPPAGKHVQQKTSRR